MTFQPVSTSTTVPQAQADRFARRVSGRLDAGARGVNHNVAERLRVARERAIAHLAAQPGLAVASQGHASVLSLGGRTGAWGKFSTLLPMFLLLAGLFCIDYIQDQYRADELADVDVELLTAELPPLAYTDPGFVQFLRSTVRD